MVDFKRSVKIGYISQGYQLIDLSVFLSPQFKFVVGSDGDCINVNSGILSGLSDPMEALMTNGMRESQERIVEWRDVETDVFVAMYQFAFTGDYDTPSSINNYMSLNKMLGRQVIQEIPDEIAGGKKEMDSSPVDKGEASSSTFPFSAPPVREEALGDILAPAPGPEAPAISDSPQEDPWDAWGQRPFPCNRTKKKKLKYATAQESIFDTDPPIPPPPHSDESALWTRFRSLGEEFSVKSRHPDKYHFNPLFHAKVYCLAESWLIGSLKDCALRHLHEDLCKMKDAPSEATKDDTVLLDLAAFAYANTACRSADGNDKLRAVVSGYIAAQGLGLQLHEDFRPLLNACGELGCDLFHLMLLAT